VAAVQSFLFGDGVAAAVVANEGKGLEVRSTVEVTNIHAKDYLAGYARLSFSGEPFKFGFQSHLDKEIPHLGTEYTTRVLKRLFRTNAKNQIRKIKKWAVHTGSAKILDALTKHHRVEREKVKESHEVLRDYGNLAGASLPFILERIVATDKLMKGDKLLMLGYGWGFSASASLLEFRD
jgi:predicted naringenin-chalcone synthase